MKFPAAFIALVLVVGCKESTGPVAAATDSPATEPSPDLHVDQTTPWRVKSSVNELDGKKKVAVVGNTLVIRCAPVFEGYVSPPLHNLGGRLEITELHGQMVRFKIDDGPLKREHWSVADSDDGLFPPARTLRAIAHGKKLTYEYEPEYVLPETTSIDLTGLSDTLRSAGCKI